ncbi:MAG TPA: CHAT domain-containing protein [Streptosporangiaceae bacterium]|nr:CHAT domain-containing protein [Streptosporangiaceae bacterium]
MPTADALARQARERALREGNAGHPAAAVRHARAGLKYLGWSEGPAEDDGRRVPEAHRALAARLLGIVGQWEPVLGRTGYGLSLLDRAENLAAAGDRGVLLLQRGLVYMRIGREADAVGVLGDAVAQLTGKPDESANLATALLNRSFACLTLVRVNQARADLVWCLRIAGGAGHDLIAAKARHNLGYCDLLAGDIPAALKLFDAAAGAYRLSAPGFLLVLAADKATALLAAGLASDAARELDEAMATSRRQRLDQHLYLAEAQLTRAQAALAAGELATARRWAAAAGRRFRQRGNLTWAGVAELTRLHARSVGPGSRAAIAAEAQDLAARLRECGLVHDADLAELLAARALVAAGRLEQAARILVAAPRRGADVPLGGRLARRLARAELAEREGRPGAALAELRAGLALVQARRGRLGSLDLQTGTGALGADLAAAGLRIALESGSAARVFAWLERSRAQAFRVRPVRPPADPRAADVLAELRQLTRRIREAELAGERDPVMASRQAELRREIREHGWKASGLGEATAPARLGEVSAALAESGQTLVGIVPGPGGMTAVVVGRGRSRLVRLGEFETAAEAARRLSADLDTLAGRRLPARLDAVIRDSARHQANVLATGILAPIRSFIGDGGMVFVPAGLLAAVPWGALPELSGRPVTVCPSATSWLAAWRRGQALSLAGAGGRPLLVAGPDLEHAAREVTEIARCYPGGRPLLGEAATVGAVLRALDGAPLAHLAAHGHHDQENFLFSQVDLADGPLMAYDIQQLVAAPRHVVLSSCDVGRTVVRPGEEILGFTAALLYTGTATVTASVTRVGDEAAVGTMTAYHRLLAAGTRPAEALAAATASDQLSPFVCFGGG